MAFTGNRMRRPSNLLPPPPPVFLHKSGRLKVTLDLTGLESFSMPCASLRQMQVMFCTGSQKASLLIGPTWVANLQVGSRELPLLQLISRQFPGTEISSLERMAGGWTVWHYTLRRSLPSSNPSLFRFPPQTLWVYPYLELATL